MKRNEKKGKERKGKRKKKESIFPSLQTIKDKRRTEKREKISFCQVKF